MQVPRSRRFASGTSIFTFMLRHHIHVGKFKDDKEIAYPLQMPCTNPFCRLVISKSHEAPW